MKKTRQLHLWIGLLCSILILIESITGLLLSERWLMGMDGEHEKRVHQTMPMGGAEGSTESTMELRNAPPQGGSSLIGIVRQLHEGRIGGVDLKWLADVSAIAMIILTVTGITLSVKTLRAQSIQRQKRLQASERSADS
jgi:hypothetical protein